MRATHKTLGRLRLSFVQVVHSHLSFVHWKSYVKSFALWYWNTFFTGTLYACCSPSPSSAHRATLHSHTLRGCERRWHRLRASSVFVHNEIICWNCYSNEYWDGNDARERTFFYDNWISFFFCPTPRPNVTLLQNEEKWRICLYDISLSDSWPRCDCPPQKKKNKSRNNVKPLSMLFLFDGQRPRMWDGEGELWPKTFMIYVNAHF